MNDIILKAQNISKQYRLGVVGTGTLGHDINRFWAKLRGKDDPYLQIGAVNDRSASASSDYVWALKDINFEVKRGEILGIIGKNGAGKSTLLKLLSRVTSPTTGSIKTKGRIASLLEVGTGMHPELTGRENIFLNGAILGMTKIEITAKIDEIVDFSGCQMYIDTPVKRYSSGMRVRLGFAVAAFLEPDILVVDEVLAVGDAEFQKKAIGKMQDISNTNGRTVLFVSHNMAAIQSLCTRAILMENGKVIYNGEVPNTIERYLKVSEITENSLEKSISNKERTGSMDISIEKVVLNCDDDIVRTGKPLELSFHLNNPREFLARDLQLDFRIDNQMGQRLLWFSNTVEDVNSDNIAKKINFKFDKLPLNQGTFIITTHLSHKNKVSDWSINAFSLVVAEGFFYEKFENVPLNQSQVLIDFKLSYNDK
ncbi:ABC transporter ATP-binding protein [Dokdonia sp. R78006]|uniref:ABC transporter ATP-binding protein n=1 Tax=Dokdonia sp. R78006 TaxID=3093866 RepID=UPI0036D2E8DB